MTYNATLAELTSLEEMMRQLMDEGSIPDEVVSMLWNVYGTRLNSFLALHTDSVPQDLSDRFQGRSDEEP